VENPLSLISRVKYPHYFFPPFFMKSVNTVTLLGNVTRDVELKTIPSGRAVATFGLATNRVWKNPQGERQSSAEFHNIVCWGRLAEFAAQYIKKGKPLMVSGHLKTGSWEAEGAKHFRTEIVAEDVVLLGSKEQEAKVEYPEKAAEAEGEEVVA
jgi:single-strand DNA-binding protein